MSKTIARFIFVAFGATLFVVVCRCLGFVPSINVILAMLVLAAFIFILVCKVMVNFDLSKVRNEDYNKAFRQNISDVFDAMAAYMTNSCISALIGFWSLQDSFPAIGIEPSIVSCVCLFMLIHACIVMTVNINGLTALQKDIDERIAQEQKRNLIQPQ